MKETTVNTNTKIEGTIKMETKKCSLDIAIDRAAKESPSIKTLLDLQVAYKRAVQNLQKDGDHGDAMVYQACTAAIRAHCVMIAERAGCTELAETLSGVDGINWADAIYMLADRIPAVDDLIKKHLL